jgi:hypothetical protein
MVSTIREAEFFAAGGVRDMIYGVGIAPGRAVVKTKKSRERTGQRVSSPRAASSADNTVLLGSNRRRLALRCWHSARPRVGRFFGSGNGDTAKESVQRADARTLARVTVMTMERGRRCFRSRRTSGKRKCANRSRVYSAQAVRGSSERRNPRKTGARSSLCHGRTTERNDFSMTNTLIRRQQSPIAARTGDDQSSMTSRGPRLVGQYSSL